MKTNINESKKEISFMPKYKQTVNICTIDRFICKRDNKSYSIEQVLPLVEEHIINNYDHTFPVEEFRKWVNSDSETHFGWNSVKYVWDCNE